MNKSQEGEGPEYFVGEAVPVVEADLFGSLVRSFENAKMGAAFPSSKVFAQPDRASIEGWIGAKELLDRAETQTEPALVETANYSGVGKITLGRVVHPDGRCTYRVIVWKAFQKLFEKDIPEHVVKDAQGSNISPLRAALAHDAELRMQASTLLLGGVGLAAVEVEEIDSIARQFESGVKNTSRL